LSILFFKTSEKHRVLAKNSTSTLQKVAKTRCFSYILFSSCDNFRLKLDVFVDSVTIKDTKTSKRPSFSQFLLTLLFENSEKHRVLAKKLKSNLYKKWLKLSVFCIFHFHFWLKLGVL